MQPPGRTGRFTPAGPGAVIEDSPDRVLLAADGQCIVGGIRLEPGEVEDVVEDVRSFMGRLGVGFAVWNICERSSPPISKSACSRSASRGSYATTRSTGW